MQTHVQKWGNSLGIRIPMLLGKQLHLQPGSLVTIEIEDHRLVIQVPKYDLDTFLDEVTPQNLHHPIFDDVQYGCEEW